MDTDIFDVIIIGSGPAGYTAGIYTTRALLKTLIIAGPVPGGQLTTTTDVENFPGFADGINGPELLENMRKQVSRFGAEIKNETVIKLKIPADAKVLAGKQNSIIRNTFIVNTENGEYETKSVIVATGASAKKLGIPSEETFRGKGISYCATCDGFFFRGKNIAVLGGGDTAMEEATFLTRFASHITIIHRREEFRASPIMLEKAKKDPKISFLLNAVVDEFYGDSIVKGLKLRVNKGQKSEVVDFPIDGVFVAIGHTPATEFLRGFIAMDEKGYIITNSNFQFSNSKQISNSNIQTATSVSGVFAAGDCVDAHYRQGIVAAGMGAQAALDAQHYLEI
jgi:thioredoxin reductase (NADPH)